MTQYPRVRSGTRRNASSRMRSNAAWSSSFRKSLARVGAIQHVIDITTLDRTGASGHELMPTTRRSGCQEKHSRPLFSPKRESWAKAYLLIGFAGVVRTDLDRHLAVEPLKEAEQLVGGEAVEMPVHQVGYLRLLDTEQRGNLPLRELPVAE